MDLICEGKKYSDVENGQKTFFSFLFGTIRTSPLKKFSYFVLDIGSDKKWLEYFFLFHISTLYSLFTIVVVFGLLECIGLKS